jgi:hypothetical protein
MGCWAEVYYFFVAGEDEAFAEIEGPDEDDNVFFASTCFSGCEGILFRESKSPAGRVIVGRTGGLIVCRNEMERRENIGIRKEGFERDRNRFIQQQTNENLGF